MDKLMDGWTNGWTNGWMDGWMDNSIYLWITKFLGSVIDIILLLLLGSGDNFGIMTSRTQPIRSSSAISEATASVGSDSSVEID